MGKVAQIAQATPADRDRYVDFLRVASLGGVIVGHFLMSVVVVGEQAGQAPFGFTNIMTVEPWTRWMTWLLQVMPIFFAVGGFAHARSWRSVLRRGGGYADFVRARAVRLLRPAAVFVVVWLVISVIVESVSDGAPHVMAVLQLAGQLLWFLGIYLFVAAMTPVMLALHERWGWRVLVVLGALVAGVDWLRLDAGVSATMWFNFAFVWLAVHQCGFFYADGVADKVGRRRLAAVMMALGALAATALVTSGHYTYVLVSYPGEERSNMVPPSLLLLVFAVIQMGVLLALRNVVTRFVQRGMVWKTVIVGGSVAMTAYLWHFTALIGMYVAFFALGADVFPDPTTGAWWWWRIPLGVAFAAGILVLIVVFRGFETMPDRTGQVGPSRWRGFVAAIGMAAGVVGMLGFAAVGFRGVLSWHVAPVGPLPMTTVVAAGLVLLAAALTWGATATHRSRLESRG